MYLKNDKIKIFSSINKTLQRICSSRLINISLDKNNSLSEILSTLIYDLAKNYLRPVKIIRQMILGKKTENGFMYVTFSVQFSDSIRMFS